MSANREHRPSEAPRILITGGAGFIGTNLAAHLLNQGIRIRILDTLAQSGSEQNLEWLMEQHAGGLEHSRADVRDSDAVRAAMLGIDHVIHLAAKPSATPSIHDPRDEFDVNTNGTLNILEAARHAPRRPSVLFTSTSKVYGTLDDLMLHPDDRRYVPEDERIRLQGVNESRTLDFRTPYACSKGAAEQYVLEYSRSFGLHTAVLRLSAIYGPHQSGNEDQAWVSHLLQRVLAGAPLTVYGDGLQVRDLLYVDDLVDALERARAHMATLSGRAFNIGGGTANTVSVLELLDQLERLTGCRAERVFEAMRLGDRRYYVSDCSAFRAATGWRPHTGVPAGLAALCDELGAFPTAPPRVRRPYDDMRNSA